MIVSTAPLSGIIVFIRLILVIFTLSSVVILVSCCYSYSYHRYRPKINKLVTGIKKEEIYNGVENVSSHLKLLQKLGLSLEPD